MADRSPGGEMEREMDGPNDGSGTAASPGDAKLFEERIVALHKKGERERAMRLFVEGYQDKIFGLAWRMFHDYDDALDAAQEVLIQVDRSLPSFRGESSLSTWVYRVASRTCLNWCKKNRRKGHDSDLDESMRVLENLRAKKSQEPESECEVQRRREVLEEALQRLPVRTRIIVILHDLDGLSSPEIAAILELSTPAVKSNLQRGRSALRTILSGSLVPGGHEIVMDFESAGID